VAWAKEQTLAKKLGLSRSQAGKRLKRLVERGYLKRWTRSVPRGDEREGRGRPSSAYRFTMPPADYFARTWRAKLEGIFAHSGRAKLEGIFARLASEFCASGDYFCASDSEDVPEKSRVAKGLSDNLHTEERLTEKECALRAPSSEWPLPAEWTQEQADEIALLRALPSGSGMFAWGAIGFTTRDGRPITAMPTIEEFVAYSTRRRSGAPRTAGDTVAKRNKRDHMRG